MQIIHQDFSLFINRALDGMLGIAEELGDERVNLCPDLPGANSPYAILIHCVGVSNYWIGTLLAGRQVPRDRAAEFRATGTVEELREAVQQLKRQLEDDILKVEGDQLLSDAPSQAYNPLSPGHEEWRQGTALIHAFEELAQHHGHMELTRDILMRG